MKKLALILWCLCSIILLKAQVSKSVECTAGNLSNLLTASEKSTITNLTITGTIDARDFKTMRDSMVVISSVNMENASILAYTGTFGTKSTSNNTYPVNSIPEKAFYSIPRKASLVSVSMPSTITSISNYAFGECVSLNSVLIPSLVTTIGSFAFYDCFRLTSITIPASVSFIESSSFAYATGNILVSDSNQNYSSVDGVLYNKDQSMLVHYPVSKTGSFTIPSTVTSLSGYAFANCMELTSITIPPTITSIGRYAFNHCEKLTSLSIPENITSIEDYTFSYCRKLTSINIPSTVKSIGIYAFSACEVLTSITIPSSVVQINSYAFYFCIKLTSIIVESPIPIDLSASTDVFKSVKQSVCTLYVPYKTKEAYALSSQWKDFSTISERDGFYLPLTRADVYSSEGSRDTLLLFSNVNYTLNCSQAWVSIHSFGSNGVDTLVISATANPDIIDRNAQVVITSANVPSQTITVVQRGIPQKYNVTAGGLSYLLTAEKRDSISNLILEGTIDARDFKTMRDSMPVLSNIDLSGVAILNYTGNLGTSGETSTSYLENAVPNNAFCKPGSLLGKSILNSILFPTSLTSIGNYSFCNCSGLTKLVVTPSISKIGDYSFYGCKSLRSLNLPVSVTTIGKYSFYNCSSLTSLQNNASLNSIGNYAFSECSSLNSFLFPSTLKSIGSSAFLNCKRLSSILIPSNVTSIGDCCFKGCSHLKSAIINSSISAIGYQCFFGCGEMSTCIIPSTITSLGYSSFAYCSSLTSLTVPSLVKIDQYAFSQCTSLTTITLPSTVTSIGANAFEYCSSLTSINIPQSITAINDFTFMECKNLTSATLPSTVKSIGISAFQGAQFTTFEIPSSVTTIGTNAFCGCSKLDSIKIPTSITSIGAWAFALCTSLTDIKIPNSVTGIEDGLFSSATSLTSIIVHSSVKSIGNYAFSQCRGLNYIKSFNPIPVDLINKTNVFYSVNTSTCKLFVPYGSKSLYAVANQWKAFSTIIEMPQLSDSVLHLSADEGSKDSITIQSSADWSIISDQPWLTLSSSSGSGSKTLIFNASRNISLQPRNALATIYVSGIPMQTISIIQEAGVTSILEHISIPDTIVANGMISCFNAYNTIVVAGGIDSVLFQSGSNIDLIAGNSIRFLPGFHAKEGCFMNAHITSDSTFCDGTGGASIVVLPEEKCSKMNVSTDNQLFTSEKKSVKVYPNPNNGRFTIELNSFEGSSEVCVYNALGKRVYQTVGTDHLRYEVSLPEISRGIYLVKVINEKEQLTKRIIVR